jgi:hypothetical protein
MDKSITLTLFAFALVVLAGCSNTKPEKLKTNACSNKWYLIVEGKVMTADNHGHGPDMGSNEWRSVVEFRLGIRGNEQNPPLGSEQWCEYINDNYIAT